MFTIGFGTEQGGQFDPACAPQFVGREPGSVGPDPFGGGGFGGGRFRRGIDEEALIEVAELTGGTYSPAESAGELSQVLAELPTSIITRHEPVELVGGVRRARGPARRGRRAARPGLATARPEGFEP